MSKITIMQGLPGSGKSTAAQALMKNFGNTVRINKDLLRTMLHFDKFSGRNESHTRDAARALAKTFLASKTNVIIDDTNLNPGTVQSWVDLAKEVDAKIEYVKMETSMAECLERDTFRQKSVGRDVIVGMALKSGLYPKPDKGFVICDLDGTLCDIRHRLHFVKGEKKDWKSFFAGIPQDTVREVVLDLVLQYKSEGYEIILVSARPDQYREETQKWLDSTWLGPNDYKTLIMRPNHDSRDDTLVKKDILDAYFGHYKGLIHRVIDDRPRVIRMWREAGLEVIDVGSGVEF